jgi:hypothetical protein
VSIVRVGLAEKKAFAEGYEAIFGKRDRSRPQPETKPGEDKPAEPTSEAKKDGPAA